MSAIIGWYNRVLEIIPETYRLPIAIIILIFLFFALFNFFKRNFIWIIIFIILLPAAWPSIKQIYFYLADLIAKTPQ